MKNFGNVAFKSIKPLKWIKLQYKQIHSEQQIKPENITANTNK